LQCVAVCYSVLQCVAVCVQVCEPKAIHTGNSTSTIFIAVQGSQHINTYIHTHIHIHIYIHVHSHKK